MLILWEKSFHITSKISEVPFRFSPKRTFSLGDVECSFKIVSCRTIFCYVPMKGGHLPKREKQSNIHPAVLSTKYSNIDTAGHRRTLIGSFKPSCISVHFYNECQNVSAVCLVTDSKSRGALMLFNVMSDFLMLAAHADSVLFFWRCCFHGCYQVVPRREKGSWRR